ncbi:MAG: 3-hydroxyacyl-CoA dehydrogenase family protein [Polyangia bacterium]|jgi:3-hydroxybutyryl-CoA dehydrogenase|nr:3-hydroxyacyl-CoA dehydrogenase family protein [Polyangia bacterium]
MQELIVVVGAGAMGRGIAQVAALAGFHVLLSDVSEELAGQASSAIRAAVKRQAEKGGLAEEEAEVMARISVWGGAWAALPGERRVVLGIEAVPEELQVKREVLQRLEARLPSEAILASNTSSIPISELAEALATPDRLVGMHFFNPPTRIKVVEVIRGEATSPHAFARALALVRALGHEPLGVERELPGFVLNRIAMAASNEAIRLLELGIASAEAIDAGVKGAFGWKMGPLETADLVGLDVVLAARTAIFERTGDERFRPPELVRRLVEAGRLGRKTGQGFHRYEK